MVLVNVAQPSVAQPSLEGKNLIGMKDVKGKEVMRECIEEAMKNGNRWVDYYWYRPGQSTATHKLACVRKVQSGADTLSDLAST